MSLPSVIAISGSLVAPSRTRGLVDAIASSIASARPVTLGTLDLAEIGPLIAPLTGRKGLAPEVASIFEAIENADLLIVGSPIYKASYTGLLKHLFDLVDPTALSGVPVVLAATGGTDRHALALDHQFRPLFAYFNATTVPTTVYALESDIDKAGVISNPAIAERIERQVGEALGLLALRHPSRVAA